MKPAVHRNSAIDCLPVSTIRDRKDKLGPVVRRSFASPRNLMHLSIVKFAHFTRYILIEHTHSSR